LIIGSPDVHSVQVAVGSHGGQGEYSVRTLLDRIPGSVFKYVRDVMLSPGSSVGEHPHLDDDEVFFIISGTGVMLVDGEEQCVRPGTAILTRAGSRHGLHNPGPEPLRFFVACAAAAPARALDKVESQDGKDG
jgi:mannose-6-phosphate isomerase-like protein (cupin superfamily)